MVNIIHFNRIICGSIVTTAISTGVVSCPQGRKELCRGRVSRRRLNPAGSGQRPHRNPS